MTAWRYQQAARLLHAGGVICHPTEGVWGFACDPLDVEAVERVLELKDRSPAQGLILIAHDFAVLRPFLLPLDQPTLDRVLPTWPGPVTWLLPVADWVPDWITGGRDTLAVRVTAHPVAAALCRAFGHPLVSTSANPSGRAPALTSTRVRAYFGLGIDGLVAGELQQPGLCSEIREADSGRLLRSRS